MAVTINIRLRPFNTGASGPDDPEDGTFLEPYPKARIQRGRLVRFAALHPVVFFKVKFQGSSPFLDPHGEMVLDISDGLERVAELPGCYHYSVLASDGVRIWEIAHCPELDVG
jgi:hypothetical protein